MTEHKPDSFRDQAEQHVRDEALRIAKNTQSPGQTKEQTRLIAKGVEKGIALYKQQQNAKARERDKARKKVLRQRASAADQTDREALPPEPETAHSPATPVLLIAGGIFSVIALVHGVRYFVGWRIVFEGFNIPASWSLAAFPVSAGLAVWMFWAARR